ncbi:glycosyltransferase [Patescibacteria group bacterium]
MKNKMPKVSVYMPVYNAGSFLVDAIESVLGQTYKNIEFIIVDDASSDSSWKIIQKYKKKYPKIIKAVGLKKNVGMGGDAAGNVAFKLAKGEFVARIDADDIAVPDRIEKQVEYMKSNPDCVLLGSNAYVINKNGRIVGSKEVPTKFGDIYEDAFVFNPIIHPTTMVRKSKINRKSLYKIKYQANNDYLTFIELIAKRKGVANLPDKLMYYRIHDSNDSLTYVKSRFLNSLRIRYKAVFEYGYRPTVKSIVKLIAQVCVILILPERAILSLYMVVKGIKKATDVLPFSTSPVFVRLKRAILPSI